MLRVNTQIIQQKHLLRNQFSDKYLNGFAISHNKAHKVFQATNIEDGFFHSIRQVKHLICDKIDEMVVLDATQIGGTALLGSPYAQGAPALKIIPKRYLGMHQWLSPIATKDLKEQIVSIFWLHFHCVGQWFYNFGHCQSH